MNDDKTTRCRNCGIEIGKLCDVCNAEQLISLARKIERRCERCVFWSPLPEDNDCAGTCSGLCHRYPPALNHPSTVDAIHRFSWSLPVVTGSHWCGEFQAASVNEEG